MSSLELSDQHCLAFCNYPHRVNSVALLCRYSAEHHSGSLYFASIWTYAGISMVIGLNDLGLTALHTTCEVDGVEVDVDRSSCAIASDDDCITISLVQCRLKSLRLSGLMSLLSQTKVTNREGWMREEIKVR